MISFGEESILLNYLRKLCTLEILHNFDYDLNYGYLSNIIYIKGHKKVF